MNPSPRGGEFTLAGERLVVSDTVGFIEDLPIQLVSAFKSTLEEVQCYSAVAK